MGFPRYLLGYDGKYFPLYDMATLVYPRPEDLKFDNEPLELGSLIEKTAVFNESRDYIKMQIIDSTKSSYSNYVGRSIDAGGNAIDTTGGYQSKPNVSIKDSIFLYIPQNLSENFQSSYSEASIGMMGAGALNALNQRGSTASMAAEVKEAANGLKPEVQLSAMASAISGVAQIAGVGGSGIDANTISALNRGAILNPYSELIYRGTQFRSHQFSFKLIARTVEDASTIYDIVQKLKLAMHPGVGGVGSDENFGANKEGSQNAQQTTAGTATGKFGMAGTNTSERWLLLPDFFKLELVRIVPRGSAEGAITLNKVMTFPVFCVLSGLTVNYTPDGQYNPIKLGEDTKEDRGVIAVNIDLTFQETAMLTKANINPPKKA